MQKLIGEHISEKEPPSSNIDVSSNVKHSFRFVTFDIRNNQGVTLFVHRCETMRCLEAVMDTTALLYR